tara:strand:- start:1227 stop:2060 length:834 start_codon:yes stop_codon:yes gene_type:complete
MTATIMAHRAKVLDVPTNVNPLLLGLTYVEINPTELCNRTCSFCPRHDPNIWPNQNLNMSTDQAILLKQQLDWAGYGGTVSFSGYGEPTLNPNFLDLCEVFVDYPVELITNGDNILKGKIAVQDLLDAGVTDIVVSDYDRNPIWKSYTDKYSQMTVRDHYDDGSDKYEEYNFTNRGGLLGRIEQPLSSACFIPSYKVLIDWNGDVILCSQNWLIKKIMGNINSNALHEIWMGKEFTDIRLSLINGKRNEVPSCANCNVKGNIFGKQQADLWVMKEDE